MPLHPQGGGWKTRAKFVVSSDTTRNYMPESKMADVSGHLGKQPRLLQFSSPPHFSGCCAKSSPINPKCHSVDGGLLLPDDRGIVAGAVTSSSMSSWRHFEGLMSPPYRFSSISVSGPSAGGAHRNALRWPFLVSSPPLAAYADASAHQPTSAIVFRLPTACAPSRLNRSPA
ncbi:hypothetical protein GE09DRAFT_493310 [Coniochaeta sp. 2T2.1]|nr:hypothetical protein GE09DRAFT_493310 [Coniochaeta sp. 2T2.1]